LNSCFVFGLLAADKTAVTPTVLVMDSSTDSDRDYHRTDKNIRKVNKVRRWKTKSERDKFRSRPTKVILLDINILPMNQYLRFDYQIILKLS